MRYRVFLAPFLLLTGCASFPTGPSVMVLPGSTKSFEAFRNDDAICQQFAIGQAGTPGEAATNSGIGSAAVGTALGAAAGAAIGGGSGAAIGAGTGLAAGGLVGTDTASRSGYAAQERFDIAYIQCMYAKGHRVPVSGQLSNELNNQPTTLPDNIPPPPPGSPPPPPR